MATPALSTICKIRLATSDSPDVTDPSQPQLLLSPELLLEIFLYVRLLYWRGPRHDEPYYPGCYGRLWIHVTHVCRYWRQTAIHASLLWNRIKVRCPKDTPYMAETLQRSQSAPLHLHLDVCGDASLSHCKMLFDTVTGRATPYGRTGAGDFCPQPVSSCGFPGPFRSTDAAEFRSRDLSTN